MERVVGIGGTFLRARDPDALLAWYASTSESSQRLWSGHVFEASRGAATVWSLFPAGTEYFGRPEQQAMLNYACATWTRCSPSCAPPATRGSPAGKAMAGMLSVFAEFERGLIAQSTLEGLAARAGAPRSVGTSPGG